VSADYFINLGHQAVCGVNRVKEKKSCEFLGELVDEVDVDFVRQCIGIVTDSVLPVGYKEDLSQDVFVILLA
jgi:hypothetical protein